MVFKSEGFTWLLEDIKEQFRRIRCSGQGRQCKFVGLLQFAGSEPSMKICKKGLHGVVHRNNISFVSVFLHPVISEWWEKGEMAGLRAHIIRYNAFYHHQYLILYFRQSQKTFGSAKKPLSTSPWSQVLSLLGIRLYREVVPWAHSLRGSSISSAAERTPFPLHRNTFGRHCESPPLFDVSRFGYPCSHAFASPGLAKNAVLVLCTSTSASWGQQAPPERFLTAGRAPATACGQPELPAHAPGRTPTVHLCSIFPAPD